MKIADWKRAVRHHLPPDPEWRFRGRLCYQHPVGRILFGVLGEGSGFDSGVYVWRVTMPMFVPGDVIDLSYSERVGGGGKKNLNSPAELSAIIGSVLNDPLDEGRELRKFVTMAKGDGAQNRRVVETAAYSNVILGDIRAAYREIEKAEGLESEFAWQEEISSRLINLKNVLDRSGYEGGMGLIEHQTLKTKTALGIA